MMKDDDTVRGENSIDTPDNASADKEANGDVVVSQGKAAGTSARRRSSGRGLYITAIVLGVIIVVLLALYIFLSLTYKKPAHTSLEPLPVLSVITQVSQG